MRRSERRVVITGLGLVSPLGIGPRPFWSALAEGRGGVGRITRVPGRRPAERRRRRGPRLRPQGACAIPKHRKALAKSLKYMARDIQLAVAAAADGHRRRGPGRRRGRPDPHRRRPGRRPDLHRARRAGAGHQPGVQRPTGTSTTPSTAARACRQITPIWLLKYLPNMLACHISILHDCQGPSNTITEAEAASEPGDRRGLPDHRSAAGPT